MSYYDSKEKIKLNSWINEHMDSGFCTESEWSEFSSAWELEYGFKPKLFDNDIRIVEDRKENSKEESEKYVIENKYVSYITQIQGTKSKQYRLDLYDISSGSEVMVSSDIYPTYKGCKISMSKKHKGWKIA